MKIGVFGKSKNFHRDVFNPVVMEEEAFEETKVVEALDRLDAVVLQPEALQVRVLLQVLDLGKALNKSFTKFPKTSLTMIDLAFGLTTL